MKYTNLLFTTLGLILFAATSMAADGFPRAGDFQRHDEFRLEDRNDSRRGDSRRGNRGDRGDRNNRGHRDDDFSRGRNGPHDGPRRFSNTRSGYVWTYIMTDNNGCNSCRSYDATWRCDRNTVGQKVKFRQPGTKNNDYVYQCLEADRGHDRNNGPHDGPRYFSNSMVKFTWTYTMTDNNGCNSCRSYDANWRCDSRTVGEKMKFRQPGTRDNDYVYQCVADRR